MGAVPCEEDGMGGGAAGIVPASEPDEGEAGCGDVSEASCFGPKPNPMSERELILPSGSSF